MGKNLAVVNLLASTCNQEHMHTRGQRRKPYTLTHAHARESPQPNGSVSAWGLCLCPYMCVWNGKGGLQTATTAPAVMPAMTPELTPELWPGE